MLYLNIFGWYGDDGAVINLTLTSVVFELDSIDKKALARSI